MSAAARWSGTQAESMKGRARSSKTTRHQSQTTPSRWRLTGTRRLAQATQNDVNKLSMNGQPMEEATFIHSADYLEVRCNGCRFKLGPIQAEVVRALHEAAQAGAPWQNGKAILSRAGSKSLRMADVFKSQKDWRQLIRSDRRGGYRLNLG